MHYPRDIVPYICSFALAVFSNPSVSLPDRPYVDFRRFRNLCRGIAPVIQSLGFQRIVGLFDIDEPQWWIIEMLQDQRLREHPWLKYYLDASAARILGIESETIPRVLLDSAAPAQDWFSLSTTAASVSVRCIASVELSL